MRTRLQVIADRAAEASLRTVGTQLQQLREDAGLPKSVVARAAGIDPTYLGYIEAGERAAGLAVLVRMAAALGADLSVRVYPTSGPPIRDRIQARMVDAFLAWLPADWDRHVEVPVYRPVRGIVDVVIVRRASGRVVGIEAHSGLRRLEQQLGWAATKADALPSSALWPAIARGDAPVATSRILLLRSTSDTRALARSFASTFAAAYAADPGDVLEALEDPSRSWPGNGIIWVRVEGRDVSIIRGVPRGARP
jgi:transcriptional regulator with XRE-family HTH domain